MGGTAAIALMLVATLPAAAAAADKPAATAPTVEDLFRQFGLFGTWAVDCKRSAGSDNPHVSDVLTSPGVVLERHDLGADRVINRYSVLSAARLSKTQVSLQVIFRPGGEGEERQRLVLVVRDGTRRTMFNQVDDGPVRVKDGVALKFGLRTPLLRKCE
jgi:hypothetical protein